MTRGSQFRTDERGISTLVSHTLAIGITSILVIGLLLSANAYLANQQQTVAREALTTVGNRLAAEVSQVDQLANRSANVTLWATHQENIAGASYGATVEHGSECDTTQVTGENCVIVFSAKHGLREVVPINNASDIRINQTAPGRFQITALERGNRAQATGISPTTSLVEENMQLGIGSNVQRNNVGGGTAMLNIPPENLSIRIDESSSVPYPQSGSPGTDFIVEAEDRDGRIDEYTIDWDDGSTTYQDPSDTPILVDGTPFHQYAEPGAYNITLTVTDNDGASTRISERINISGLQLSGMSRSPTSGSNGQTVTFDLRNEHDREIRLSSIVLDPDDSTDAIYNDGGYELAVDTDADGSYEYEIPYWDFPRGTTILDTGLSTGTALDLGTDPSNLPRIDANSNAVVQFRGIRSGGDDAYDVTMNYVLDGDLVTSTYRDVTPSDFPVASLSYSPSDPHPGDSISFDGTGSSDPDGNIVSYEWDFGDGNTASGPTPSHTYSSAGSYTVTLTVTDDDGNTATTTENVVVGDPVVLTGHYTSGSYLEFSLENTGSSDRTIERVDVDITSGAPPSELDENGGDHEVEIDNGGPDIGFLEVGGSYGLGSDFRDLDDEATIPAGDTVTVQLRYFRDSSNNYESVAGETIAFTVEYSDGTQQTFTIDT
ncbi:MAG: PKD domain-containing protein [Halobaculum sp.]